MTVMKLSALAAGVIGGAMALSGATPGLDGDRAQPLARYGAPDGTLAHGCVTAELHHETDVTKRGSAL